MKRSTSIKRNLYKGLNALVGSGNTQGVPILVIGNGRSGTSWIGEVLGKAPQTLYYREPCHPRRNGLGNDSADHIWTRYVRPEEDDPYFESALNLALNGHFWQGCGYGLRDYQARFTTQPRIIIKEVASFLSLAWLASKWNLQILVVVRHPGAYAASVRNLSQDSAEINRLALLCANSKLADDHIAHLLEHLSRLNTPLEASVGAWAVRNLCMLETINQIPNIKLIHYESIAENPVQGFEKLYLSLGLKYSQEVAEHVRMRSSSTSDGLFSTSRISRDRVDAWKKELNEQEKTAVRRTLEPFNLPWYCNASEW